MENNRPAGLNNFLESQTNDNDEAIVKALNILESPENWKKYKPSVNTISRLTNLSRNTIRNREWALNRLKIIKDKRKKASEQVVTEDGSLETPFHVIERLRIRVKSLQEQNVLLYEEVINLQLEIKRKDIEIKTLKIAK